MSKRLFALTLGLLVGTALSPVAHAPGNNWSSGFSQRNNHYRRAIFATYATAVRG